MIDLCLIEWDTHKHSLTGYLGKLKKMVKNKARVEGSICEAYLCQETAYFYSYYFESEVPSMRKRSRRNEFVINQNAESKSLSIFQPKGRPSGKSKHRYLTQKEYDTAHLHILINCEEVGPYIDIFSNELRGQNPRIRDDEVDEAIANEFASWFKNNVEFLKLQDDEHHTYLCQLALGPLRYVTTWPIYFVNGYKFHTEEKNEGKKTYNCGVCVKGVGESNIENFYYGVLKEVVEFEYVGEPIKKCVLFSCDWFDPSLNRGIRRHKYGGFVEIHRRGRYGKYDPFIFANTASQVYYMPYPEKTRDKVDWLVVVPTKPRSRVDNRYTLEVAYQEDNMSSINVHDDDSSESLRDDANIEEELQRHEELEEEDDEEEEEFDDESTSDSGEEETEDEISESDDEDD